MILSIPAYFAHFAQFFLIVFFTKNECFDTCLSMQIQGSISVSIAGHLGEWF